MIYRQPGEQYLLYSVGPDQKDDGGKKVTDQQLATSPGDLFLTERPRPRWTTEPGTEENEAAN